MKKVVLYQHGDFYLPDGMARAYKRDSGKEISMDAYGNMIIDREDPNLIALVEKLKEIYNKILGDPHASLNSHDEISFISHFTIEEYDEKEFSYEIVRKDTYYFDGEELIIHPLISLHKIKAMSDLEIREYFRKTFGLVVVD